MSPPVAIIADIGAFERSLTSAAAPPSSLTPPLRALWHARKADLSADADSEEWRAAVSLATDPRHGHPHETNLAWVHALLLRIAGDDSAAAERYNAASRVVPPPSAPATEEWQQIASTLLAIPFVPVFYVLSQRAARRGKPAASEHPAATE